MSSPTSSIEARDDTLVLNVRGGARLYFGDQSSLALLEPILELPFRSPEVDRRWQLVRMAAGLQAAPQPAPLLCARSEENLNPEFWCASRRA